MANSTSLPDQATAHFRGALLVYVIGAWFLDVQIPVSGLNVGNLILVSCCLWAAAIAVVKRAQVGVGGLTLLPHDWIYLIYILFALGSTLWAPSRVSTAVQGIYLAAVWLAVVNLGHASAVQLIRIVVRLAFVTAVLSFALVPISPPMAFQPESSTAIPELRGIFSHQLRLGLFMAVTLGLAILAALNGEFKQAVGNRTTGAFMLLCIAGCLIAAFARLYTGAMIVALVLTVGLSRNWWIRLLTMFLVIVGVGVTLYFAVRAPVVLATSDIDLTLTGRTILWERTLSFAGPGRWFGFGYASFDHSTFDALWPYWRPAHPHNSFIQAYFETGYIGLALTLLLVAVHFREGLHVSGVTRAYSYSLFLVLLTTLGSLTGSNYAGKPTLLLCLLLVTLTLETRRVRRVRGAPTGRSSPRAAPSGALA